MRPDSMFALLLTDRQGRAWQAFHGRMAWMIMMIMPLAAAAAARCQGLSVWQLSAPRPQGAPATTRERAAEGGESAALVRLLVRPAVLVCCALAAWGCSVRFSFAGVGQSRQLQRGSHVLSSLAAHLRTHLQVTQQLADGSTMAVLTVERLAEGWQSQRAMPPGLLSTTSIRRRAMPSRLLGTARSLIKTPCCSIVCICTANTSASMPSL